MIDILSDRLSPQRLGRLEQDLQAGDAAASLAQLTPADTFHLAAEFRHNFSQDTASLGAGARNWIPSPLDYRPEVDLQRLSRDFGTPHPVLAREVYLRAGEPAAVPGLRWQFQPLAG